MAKLEHNSSLQRAFTSIAAADFAGARRALEAAIKADPHSRIALMLHSTLTVLEDGLTDGENYLRHVLASQTESPNSRLLAAYILHKAGDMSARIDLEILAKGRPHSHLPSYLAGLALLRDQEYLRAAAFLLIAVHNAESAGTRAHSLYRLGCAMQKLGFTEASELAWREAELSLKSEANQSPALERLLRIRLNH